MFLVVGMETMLNLETVMVNCYSELVTVILDLVEGVELYHSRRLRNHHH